MCGPVVNGFFLACDKYGWFARCKIPRTPAMAVSPQLFHATIRDALLRVIPNMPLGMVLFKGMAYYGADFHAPPPPVGHAYLQVTPEWCMCMMALPPCPRCTCPPPRACAMCLHSQGDRFVPLCILCCCLGEGQLMTALLFLEFTFYWAHRLLHHPLLYARFHKQHHEYKGTIGFAAEYASVFEQLVATYVSTVLLPMVRGTHPLLWLLWLDFRLSQTYEAHSG